MGTCNTKINGNDTFQDIYQSFFAAYNDGQEPDDISKRIQKEYAEMFQDSDDRNNSLFGLALAQWETMSLDPSLYKQVKEIIETGKDLEVWKGLGADEKSLKLRKNVLKKFLLHLSTNRDKPKRRVSPKFDFTYKELINEIAPDGKKTFTVHEHFTNGTYTQTGSMMSWDDGGGSILYFTGQGQYISARWLDSQTLEVTHDKEIQFTKKDESFYFCGDEGKVIYIEKTYLSKLSSLV
jgi:hypothetical protein